MNLRPHEPAFSGRHMLMIMLAFFGVIIGVNVTMAWFARSSWTGLVVQNSYVASQQFNARMAETRAQAALGWTADFVIADGEVRYALHDAAGSAIPLDAVTVTFRRPVDDRKDYTIHLSPTGRGHAARNAVAAGAWIVEIEAEAGLPRPYRETRRIKVLQGKPQ